MKRSLGISLLIIFFTFNSFAASFTTWAPQEFECPIDKEKNTFMVIMSFGSYIYSWPSKYQWLFFPRTDSPTFYLCKKCHLATYMWDFDKLPKDKLDAIREVLKDVKVSKSFKDYTEIPTTERLEIMEKVYRVLDKDDDWWETFYRIKGYHYGQSQETAKASEARTKSLEILNKELNDPKSETPKKLLYYISGSMKHFLGDDAGAIADMEKGLTTKYAAEKATAEDIANAETGLNARFKDYIERIKTEKDKPRMLEGTDKEH